MKVECQIEIHSCEFRFTDAGFGNARVDIHGMIHPLDYREPHSAPHFHVSAPVNEELRDLIKTQLEEVFGREIDRKTVS